MIQNHQATVSVPDVVELDIRADHQETPMWCWAACAVAVAKFVKLPTVPTEGQLANLLTGRTDCTDSPVPKECVVPAEALSITAVYQAIGVNRVGPDLPLTINTLLMELVAGRPVEVGYLWYQGGGHVAIVRGYRKWTNRFIVSDPWFGDGELSYLEIANGYGVGRWAYSYGRFSRGK